MERKMDDMIPLETIRDALQDRRLTVVAEKSGLSHPTVKAVATGNERISLNTWRKLSEYLTVYK
mgnify:FL=1|tara:strand:- start:8 stop:199 length:192 start_codon:yes stop_codon:yes gene_type:complete